MDRQLFRRNPMRWFAASVVVLLLATWWIQIVHAPIEFPPHPRSPAKLQAWLMTTPAPAAPRR